MLVSIIIPCYNVENYIAACIESALKQTHPETEIICIDNNSTDKTVETLRSYKAKYPEKIQLLSETKQGAPAARNLGLQAAKGEWIQFLDADDILLPDKIKNQVVAIRSAKENFDVVVAPLTRILISSQIVHINIAKEVWYGLITSRAGSTCSNLYKKEALLKINGWDESRISSQEAWLLFDLLKSGVNVMLFDKDETVVNERASGSISNTNRSGNWERYLVFRKEIWDYLKQEGKLTLELENKLKGYIFDSIRMIYRENQKKSQELYNNYVKTSFFPVPSDATSRKYIYILKFLGFNRTEKLFTVFK